MKTPRSVLHQMAIDAWAAGTVLFVLCLGLEAASAGFVSRFFNLLWLLVFVLAASVAAMATQSRLSPDDASHRSPRAARSLLYLGCLSLGVAAWFLIPADVKFFWRAAASGGILLAMLIAWPVFSPHE